MKIKKEVVIFLLSLIFLVGVAGLGSATITSITVNKPNGGEYWGGTKDIEWSATCTDGDYVDILWTRGGGWTVITSARPCNSYLYSWNTNSVSDNTNYQIKIADTNNPSMNDVSNAAFTTDNTPPSKVSNLMSTSHIVSEYSNDNTIDFSWTAAIDVTSGLKGYSILLDSNPTTIPDNVQEIGTVTSYTTDTLIDGTYYFHIRSVDNANNWDDEAEHLGPFYIDSQAPITTDNSDANWHNSDVTVTLTPTDTLSGVANTYYCVDQANSCTPTTPGTSVVVSTEGINYVRYYSVDNVGNSETPKSATNTVKIDKTSPGTADNVPSGWQTTSPLIITLALTINDGLSPTTTYYTSDGSDPTTSSNSGTTITLTEDGVYTIKYFTIDEAGNTEEIKQSANQAMLDANAPIFNSVTSDKSYYKDGNTITVTANLGETGLNVLGDFSNVDTSLPFIVTGYTGVVEYSNEQSYNGDYSIKMLTQTTTDQGRFRLPFTGNLEDIDSFSYWNYVVNGGTFGQLAIWSSFYLDANGNGVFDYPGDYYLQCEPYYTYGYPTLNTWQQYDVMNMRCVGLESPDYPHEAPTLADYISGAAVSYQTQYHGIQSFASREYGSLPIIKIDMRAGYGSPWAGFVGYMDDVELNTNIIYDEPDVASDNGDETYTLTHTINTAPDDGSYTIPVTVTDEAGNSNRDDSLSVGIDNTLPSVVITPIIGWKKDTINVEYTITETNKDVCEYRYNGLSWSPISCDSQFNFDTNNCPDGINSCTIDVKATDTAGNSATDYTTFSVDNSAPIITSLTLSDDTIQEGTSIIITSDGTDPQGVKSCMAYLVSTDGLTQYQSYTLTDGCDGTETINPDPDVPDENYKIKVKVKNNADTISELTANIKIDDNPPTIILNDVSVDEGSSIVLDASGSSDVPAGIATYEWDLDYDGITFDVDATGSSTTFDASSLDGPTIKTVGLKVTDNAENYAIDIITVTVNNVAPTITTATADKTTATVNEIVMFTGSASDPAGVNDPLTYNWDFGDGGTSTSQNPTYAYSSRGTYTVSLIVTDGDGGSATSTLSITVNDLIWTLSDSEWNLVSAPKILTVNSKAVLLPSNAVWEYDATESNPVNRWKQSTTINPGVGYWVNNAPLTELGLNYAAQSGPGGVPGFDMTTINLQQGWNLIGHMCTNIQDIEVAFPSNIYSNLFVLRYNEATGLFEIYATQNPSSAEFEEMTPGEGYWIFVPSGNLAYTNYCN